MSKALRALAEAKLEPKIKDVDPDMLDFAGEDNILSSKKPKTSTKKATSSAKKGTGSKLRANAAMLALSFDEKYSGETVDVKELRKKQGLFIDSENGDDHTDAELHVTQPQSEAEEEEAVAIPTSSLRPGKLLPHGAGNTSQLVDDVDAELENLENVEAQAMMLHVKRAQEDAQKGKIVEQQIYLNDYCLETRIRLQKSLAAANRLPVGQAYWKDAKVAKAYGELSSSLSSLLHDFCELRAELMLQNDTVGESARVVGKKRGRDARDVLMPTQQAKRSRKTSDADSVSAGLTSEEVWPALESAWTVASEFRTTTIDAIGRKLTFAGGLSAKQAVKLKVMGADISKQVAEVLADKTRVIARTRPAVADVNVIGGIPSAAVDTALKDTADAHYMEAYDDHDFYQQLLRDFVSATAKLEKEGGLSGDALPVTLMKHPSKKRQGIDRRATKGRRLKFVVHPKLVNFTAPAPYVVPPEMTYDLDTVVASLLKQ